MNLELEPSRERVVPASERGAGQGGFTLLEVLLAVAIAAVVLVAVNGVFFGAIRLRNAATRSIEATLPLQRALGIIERDLVHIVPPGGKLGGTLQSRSDTPLLLGQKGPSFHTATARLEDHLPWGEVQRVAYLLLEPSTNDAVGMDLYRAVLRNVLSPAYETPEYEWLLSGVEDLRFEFFDGNQWTPEWDSTTQDPPLPAAIRVELLLAARRGETLPLPMQVVVPLLIDGRTNATANGNSEESP